VRRLETGVRQDFDEAKSISSTDAAMETMKRYCDAHPESPSAVRRPQLLVLGGVSIALHGATSRKELLDSVVEAALRAFDAQHLSVSRPRSTSFIPTPETV
jgi:transposase